MLDITDQFNEQQKQELSQLSPAIPDRENVTINPDTMSVVIDKARTFAFRSGSLNYLAAGLSDREGNRKLVLLETEVFRNAALNALESFEAGIPR